MRLLDDGVVSPEDISDKTKGVFACHFLYQRAGCDFSYLFLDGIRFPGSCPGHLLPKTGRFIRGPLADVGQWLHNCAAESLSQRKNDL